MRSIRKASIAFGIVSVPIQVYAATENKDVKLRQVHAADGGRIKYKRVCEKDGEEVPYCDIAKGYEDGDDMIVLAADDLANLPLPSTSNIEVTMFVPAESIDPMQHDRTYYLAPQKDGERPYCLLREALRDSGRVAVGKVTLRQREAMAMLRVVGDVIVLTTLLWPDEVREPKFKFLDFEPPTLTEAEMEMAAQLVDAMAEDAVDLDEWSDGYREALEAVIAGKTGHYETNPKQTDADGLVAALTASLEDRKKVA